MLGGVSRGQRRVRGRDVVRFGEPGVAFVVRGDAHQRAGPVVTHDVVRFVHSDFLAGQRVGTCAAGGRVPGWDRKERDRRQRVRSCGEHGQVSEVDLPAFAAADPHSL
jgi:hypothetical protein